MAERFTKNSAYVLTTEFPVPELVRGTHVNLNLPLGEMEVGESFLTGADTYKVKACVYSYNHRNRQRLLFSKTDQEGTRVWRVR